MKKFILIGLMIATCIVVIAEQPKPAFFANSYSGAIMAYIANLGTNSVIEYDYTYAVPSLLAEVTATTNGVATDVIVSRVWNYSREKVETVVSTNLFGNAETNIYNAGFELVEMTNELYDSTSDTLPTPHYFLQGDVVRITTGSVTGATIRVMGKSN